MRVGDLQRTSMHTVNIRCRGRARRQVGGAWAYQTAIFRARRTFSVRPCSELGAFSSKSASSYPPAGIRQAGHVSVGPPLEQPGSPIGEGNEVVLELRHESERAGRLHDLLKHARRREEPPRTSAGHRPSPPALLHGTAPSFGTSPRVCSFVLIRMRIRKRIHFDRPTWGAKPDLRITPFG